MADGVKKDWRELCLAVSEERDSTKLTSLVQELIEVLDNSLHRSLFSLARTDKNRKLPEN
jgi:hypothetical protein